MPMLKPQLVLTALSVGDALPSPQPSRAPDETARLSDDVWLHHVFPRLGLTDVLSPRTHLSSLAYLDPCLWVERVRTAAPAHGWVLGANVSAHLENNDRDQWTRDAGIGLESAHLISLSVQDGSWPNAFFHGPYSDDNVSRGPPAFVQIVTVIGHVLGLDPDGQVWVVNAWSASRSACYRYGRLPLPFRVKLIAADMLTATVLSTSGRMYELRDITHWVSYDGWPQYHAVAHCPDTFSKASTDTESAGEDAESLGGVIYLFAAGRNPPLMGVCITDGNVHVWVRTVIATAALRVARGARGLGPRVHLLLAPDHPILADGVHTLPLPGLRKAAMGEDFILALTDKGEVWVAGVDIERQRSAEFTDTSTPDAISGLSTNTIGVIASGLIAAVYSSPESGVGHIVRVAYMPEKKAWCRHGFGEPNVHRVTFLDALVEVVLSDYVLAAITIRGVLYTCSPHDVLSHPAELTVPTRRVIVPCPLNTMSPVQGTPVAFTLAVDRDKVYAMAFAPPLRRSAVDPIGGFRSRSEPGQ